MGPAHLAFQAWDFPFLLPLCKGSHDSLWSGTRAPLFSVTPLHLSSATPALPTLILAEVILVVIYYGVINSCIMRREGSGTFGEYPKGYTIVVFICTLGRNFVLMGKTASLTAR